MAINVQRVKNLNTVTTIPSGSKVLLTPDDGNYARASVGNLVGSAMDDDDFITNNGVVSLNISSFVGTTTEWNALSTTEKAKYTLVNLTDDGGSEMQMDTVPTSNSNNAITSGGVYTALQNISMDDKSNLSNIVSDNESSSTATKNYSIGDYFSLNGNLARVIDDIEIGDTLVEDTNYVVTNIGDELKPLKLVLSNDLSNKGF